MATMERCRFSPTVYLLIKSPILNLWLLRIIYILRVLNTFLNLFEIDTLINIIRCRSSHEYYNRYAPYIIQLFLTNYYLQSYLTSKGCEPPHVMTVVQTFGNLR